MKRVKGKLSDPEQTPPVPSKNRFTSQPAPSKRLQADARWQRFQRYAWDKKKG